MTVLASGAVLPLPVTCRKSCQSRVNFPVRSAAQVAGAYRCESNAQISADVAAVDVDPERELCFGRLLYDATAAGLIVTSAGRKSRVNEPES